MERLLIQVPALLKAKLDALRTQGFTTSGYIRALLERELADVPPTYPGQPPVIRNARPQAPRIVREGGKSAPSRKRPGPWHSDGKGGFYAKRNIDPVKGNPVGLT